MSGKVLTDLLEFHYLELSKLVNTDTPKNEPWYPWTLFLNNPNSDVLQMVKKDLPELEKALALLEELSADQDLKNLYESRLKARLDQGSAIAQATRNGIEQERKRNVIGLYKSNIPLETISTAMNMQLDELNLIISDSKN